MKAVLGLTQMETFVANVLIGTVPNALSGSRIRKTERKIAMKIISPSAHLLTTPDYEDVLALIENAGRTCYKSEDKISKESAERFIRNIIQRGHESVLEHASFTARFICDRGCSHEIVRHRLASYSQESTRYCNYADDKFQSEITVIQPCFFETDSEAWKVWHSACLSAEKYYFKLLELGCSPRATCSATSLQ